MEQDQEVVATRNETARRSDEDLLLEYRESGNRESFEQLVHRYERELFNYLRQYLGDAQMAEDAFQTTFLQVHLKCEMFEPGRRVRPWLYTVATNQAIDAQRRNKRHRMVSLDRRYGGDNQEDIGSLVEMLDSGAEDPLERIDAAERGEVVRDCVDGLPETLKQVILLVYYQGLKYREAADVLSIPVGTVKSRLHAAVSKLHAVLSDTPLSDHD
jgi:RNA polymerase sigma-70 factor (ECF subfamily)